MLWFRPLNWTKHLCHRHISNRFRWQSVQSNHVIAPSQAYHEWCQQHDADEDIAKTQILQELDRIYWASIHQTTMAPGVFIHGSVGSGKTLCMDLFHRNVAVGRKRRLHYHAFMLQVHRQMKDAPVEVVANQLRNEIIGTATTYF